MVENGTDATVINNNSTSQATENETLLPTSGAVTDDSTVLPNNCTPLAHQVAGHFFGKGRTKLGNYADSLIFFFYL